MPDSVAPSSEDLAVSIKTALSNLRQLLLHSPTSLSAEISSMALSRISLDLLALSEAVIPPPQQELLEIQALNQSVQSLYRGAANFFGELSGESIKNGGWDAAAYSAEGEWTQPRSGVRIQTEG
ncbi:MAG: hypothetical protein FJW36_17350 [Acidobacteria bacterium]|nr:hypothetical protein [Acidobacteriota bacterium]